MSYRTLKKGAFSWSWKEYGHGNRILMAFHGFNRSPDDFEPFSRWLGDRYTLLAFDLFFNGKSYVELDSPFPALSYPVLKELLDEILERHNASEFEILAYSFGGRLALNCLEIYPGQVKGIYLLAPDGLRFNPGFWFAVATRPGNMLFKRFTKDPASLLALLNILARLRLYNSKALEFYRNHLLFEPMRYRVYHCWMLHRKTVPDLKRISEIIKTEHIPVHLFFGKYDVIIPPVIGKRFAERIGRPQALHTLETGHRLQENHREISKIIIRETGEQH